MHPIAKTALVLGLLGLGGLSTCAQSKAGPRYLVSGLFIASIEEGARIFTPVRFLPFEHPESMGHQFPNILQCHKGEEQVLLTLGEKAGYRLRATLERYPCEPDTLWPYSGFTPPPADAFRNCPISSLNVSKAPIPGLRALAVIDRTPVAFVVDTRTLSLAERHMARPTTMGLDMTRAEFLKGLDLAAEEAPETGAAVVVYSH